MRIAVAVACLSVGGVSVATEAQAAIKQQTDISAQGLGPALEAFAADRNLQLVYATDEVDSLRTSGAVGKLTADQALAKLLSGTGLTYRFLDDKTITVLPTSGAASTAHEGRGGQEASGVQGSTNAESKQASASLWNQFRLARADQGMNPNSSPMNSKGSSNANALTSPGSNPDKNADLVLTEIVVTATKRPERLIDVPFAVSSLNAEDLTDRGQVNLQDYTSRVPGVAVTNASVAGEPSQIVIRGLTTGGGGNPTVAVYVNDTPVSSSTAGGNGAFVPDIDPADLERIEVLRGPQGTLYGAASIGGLVRYITREPDFNNFSGRVEVDGTAIDGGGDGYAARARVNVPVNDILAMTASVFHRDEPGFIDNTLTGRDNVNRTLYDGGRAAFALNPSDGMKITLAGYYQLVRSEAYPLIALNATTGLPEESGFENAFVPGSNTSRMTVSGADLRIENEFSGFNLISDTSFGSQKFRGSLDYTPAVGSLLDKLAKQPPDTLGALLENAVSTDKVTQEVRATSTGSGFLGWQLGGFFTHEKNDGVQMVAPVTADTGGPLAAGVHLPELLDSSIPNTYQEVAGFGDVT
jgi:iron complex outermembrane receptor protein